MFSFRCHCITPFLAAGIPAVASQIKDLLNWIIKNYFMDSIHALSPFSTETKTSQLQAWNIVIVAKTSTLFCYAKIGHQGIPLFWRAARYSDWGGGEVFRLGGRRGIPLF